MDGVERTMPVAAGDVAPDFALLAVDGSGAVGLGDYRAKSPLFLALFLGLWCPFCRRALAQTAASQEKLRSLGIETLGVVATQLENAQLYFKYRARSLRIVVDPELSTHRAYGLPKPATTPEFFEALAATAINPGGELPKPLPIMDAVAELGKLDGFSPNATDRADMEHQFPQLKGQFLIDRGGVVRWVHIDCAKEGLSELGKFPSFDEIADAARTSGALH